MHRNVLSATQSAQVEGYTEDRSTGPARLGTAARGALMTNGELRPALPKCVFTYGFSFNKRRNLRRFVAGSRVRQVRHVAQLPHRATLLLWGSAPLPHGLRPDIALIRVEDGFLRSVGLGAELVRPISWVMDRRRLYYDATGESDLEYLLQNGVFTAELLMRAAAFRARLASCGITKYSVGRGTWARPKRTRVILVPGQVESDASIRFGAPAVCTNIGLLSAVREANPDGYVVYKPHPDVVAGLRARGSDEQRAAAWCDEIVTDVSVDALLDRVDEVHVLTSLAGFEALLRGKSVTCYGLPFYAGWGLTRDLLSIERRKRRLTLDELVAAALIVYPCYVSRSSGGYISPEQALDELLQWRERQARRPQLWRHLWRPLLRLAMSFT